MRQHRIITDGNVYIVQRQYSFLGLKWWCDVTFNYEFRERYATLERARERLATELQYELEREQCKARKHPWTPVVTIEN